MILFRVDIRGSEECTEFYSPTLSEARDFARGAFNLPCPQEITVTIYRCATRPAIRGAALVLASLNGFGWMAEGSLLRIETYTLSGGKLQVVPSTKGS